MNNSELIEFVLQQHHEIVSAWDEIKQHCITNNIHYRSLGKTNPLFDDVSYKFSKLFYTIAEKFPDPIEYDVAPEQAAYIHHFVICAVDRYDVAEIQKELLETIPIDIIMTVLPIKMLIDLCAYRKVRVNLSKQFMKKNKMVSGMDKFCDRWTKERIFSSIG